mmetsp:Transcript_21742/g.61687  ORF Transcript_21742/g.61687 Transcript_21742/m.61687 type:complete len:245 (+) Transcript_21742:110-844(+)
MSAGITCYYDRSGGETADLCKNQWPTRPGEPKPNEYGTTTCDYGVHVPCHAGQSYQAPAKVAGTSKRMGAFYERTGVLQHRSEPGFRDTKAACVLTEVRAPEPGASGVLGRLGGGLGNAGSMVLSTSALNQTLGRPDDVQSRRSRGSAASSRRSANSVGGPAQSAAGSSRASAASSAPSWAKRAQAEQRPPWNYEPLPMYGRTNDTYGKCHEQGRLPQHIRAAGKSDSGFLDPVDLIATLTRPH